MTTTTVDTQVLAAGSGGTSTPVKLTLQGETARVGIELRVRLTTRSAAPAVTAMPRKIMFSVYWAFSPQDLSASLATVPTLLRRCAKCTTLDFLPDATDQVVQAADRPNGQYMYVWFEYPQSVDGYTVTATTTESFFLNSTSAYTFLGLTLSGNRTSAAWGASGIRLNSAAGTFTDSSSTGTVATNAVNSFGVPTLAASSATTYTNAATVYIAGDPVAGTNVTLTNKWAFWNVGKSRFDDAACFADGTAAAPSMSFKNSTGTGLYLEAGNSVGVASGGTGIFRLISSTGSYLTGTGARTDTALLLGLNGNVGLIAGGTNQNITLTPSGTGLTAFVGASQTSYVGSIVGAVAFGGFYGGGVTPATTNYALACNGFDTFLNGPASGIIHFAVSGTEVARFHSNGRLGINTGATDSGALLQIGTNSTTSAGGMVFGTDCFVYRSFTNSLTLSGILNCGGGNGPAIRLGQSLTTTAVGNYGGQTLDTWANGTAEASVMDFNKSRGAGAGNYTVVQNNDRLGYVVFRGADGTVFRDSASIVAEIDGTPGASDMPGRLLFSTSSDGSSTPTERLRISANGAATFSGLIFPQQATTAGAPTYVKGAIYFDTTLNKLRIGGATAWETITSV